jgi:hypothetical protein
MVLSKHLYDLIPNDFEEYISKHWDELTTSIFFINNEPAIRIVWKLFLQKGELNNEILLRLIEEMSDFYEFNESKSRSNRHD